MSEDFKEQQKEKFIEYLTRNADQETICVDHHRNVEECDEPVICELLSASKEDHEQFDIRAQDVNDWAWVQEFVPELIIYSAGGQLPFQAEGFIKGFPFYFRTEDGYAALRVSDSKETLFPIVDALYSATIEIENEGLTGKEWVSHLFTLIEKLEKTEKLYFFQTNKVDFGDDGNTLTGAKTDENGKIVKDSHCVWANSADEAWSKLDYRKYIKDHFGTNHYGHLKDTNYEIWASYEKRLWSNEMIDNFVKYSDIQPIVVKVEGDDRNYPNPEPSFEVDVPELWRNDDGSITVPLNN